MNHIRMGELDVAERLAVTSNQINMVIKAKNLKIQGVAGNPKNRTYRGGATGNPESFQQNPVDSGLGNDSAARDFDVQTKAKRDYQKQQIPGFITHQPTDAHERGVYKQEMNRQKNMDPNTWSRLLDQ